MAGYAQDGVYGRAVERRLRRRLWLASIRAALDDAALAVQAIGGEGIDTSDAASRIAAALDAVVELDARLGAGNGS